jgi:predicted Zn-dependent protease
MKRSSIPTARRVQYARGFLELGMLAEAAGELDAIHGAARIGAEVMELQVDLHMAARHWELVVAMGQELTVRYPAESKGWISRAFALRELGRIREAKEVLLQAEPEHGKTCSVLHYNLACYHCLLGEMKPAKDRLARACKMEKTWKQEARSDPDLKALWKDLPASA